MRKSTVSRVVRSAVLSLAICLSIAGWMTEGSRAGAGTGPVEGFRDRHLGGPAGQESRRSL